MKIRSNSESDRGLSFVDSLYKNLRQQAKNAVEDRDRLVSQACSYLKDGVTNEECIELMVIDGLERDAAENFVQAATEKNYENGDIEYSFQFEDVYGNIWSSCEIDQIVYASNSEDAWTKAESQIFLDSTIEPHRIISVDRIL